MGKIVASFLGAKISVCFGSCDPCVVFEMGVRAAAGFFCWIFL